MIRRIQAVFENGDVPADGIVPLETAPVPMSWPRGEDGSIIVSVVDQAGDPVDLTGASLALGVRVFPFDTDPVFVRAGSVTDAPGGVAAFTLVAADTSGLSPDHYRFDVWLVIGGQRYQIVLASDFQVLEADTLASETASAATAIPPGGAVDTVNTTGDKLSAVASSNLKDGAPIWVRDSGGGIGSYFHVEIGKHYVVDHVNYETAFGLTDGQWVRGLGIASSGGGAASGVAIDFDNYWITTTTGEEVVDVPKFVNFTHELDSSVANLIPELTSAARVSGGTGTLRVRIGGTIGLADGTVIASGTITGTSIALATETGASFAKPSGAQLLQITLQQPTGGQTIEMKGARLGLRSA